MKNILHRTLPALGLALVCLAASCNGTSHQAQGDTLTDEEKLAQLPDEIRDSLEMAEQAEINEKYRILEPSEGYKLLVIDFWAEWCPPCRQLKPIFEAAKEKYEGKAELMSINVDQQRKLAENYDISGIPTLIFVNSEGIVVERVVGFIDAEALDRKIQAHLK